MRGRLVRVREAFRRMIGNPGRRRGVGDRRKREPQLRKAGEEIRFSVPKGKGAVEGRDRREGTLWRDFEGKQRKLVRDRRKSDKSKSKFVTE